MPIYKESHRVASILLGTRRVSAAYLGEDRVFSEGGGPFVVYDNGYVSGIGWSGNLLRRSDNTSRGLYDLSHVATDGAMELYVSAQSSHTVTNHNCHVCTTDFIAIPATATVLKIEISKYRDTTRGTYVKFGLLPANYVDSRDASLGGVMSSTVEIAYASRAHQTLSVELPAGIAGTDDYRVVINLTANQNGSANPRIDVHKVWFE